MIEDPNCIDLLGLRRDGGADLLIVSSGALDDSPETQALLLDKIEHYLEYINSDAFRAECPGADAQNTRIVLRLSEPPPVLIRRLAERIAPWTAAHNAAFALEIRP